MNSNEPNNSVHTPVIRAFSSAYAGILSPTTQPLPKPMVDPQFAVLNTPSRLFECLRFFLADLEYSLAPDGKLRHIAKVWARIAIGLAIPLLAIWLILMLLVPIFLAVAAIFTSLEVITRMLLLSLCWLTLAVVVLQILLMVSLPLMRLLSRFK